MNHKTKVNPKKGNVNSIAEKTSTGKKKHNTTLSSKPLTRLVRFEVEKAIARKFPPPKPVTYEACAARLNWYFQPLKTGLSTSSINNNG